MPRNAQLLKLVRKAAATIHDATDNPEHKLLLAAADVIFNELMLREQPRFYIDYLAGGRQLVEEGRALLQSLGINAPTREVLRDEINSDTRFDVINEESSRLSRQFVAIVDLLDETRSEAEKNYLVRLADWENSLYAHRLDKVAIADATGSSLTPSKLQAYLRAKFPELTDLKVLSLVSLAGGFSKKTILFETEDAVNGRQALVMRAEQPADLLGYEGSDVTQEFYSIQLMRRSGLPIAEPLWLEADCSRLGMRFIVSRKAIGKTQGGNFGSDAPISDKLLRSMLSTFIRMHDIRLDADDPLVQKSHFREWMSCKTVTEATRYCINTFMRRLIHTTDIPLTPQLLRGLKWLERNVPQVDEPPVIVHGDFAFNNLIIDNDEITAVLDWESSRLGDPAEDIIWTQPSLATCISLPDFLAHYREATGRDISEFRLAYCRVVKCAFSTIACLSALRALDRNDDAHIILGMAGLQYMGIMGGKFNMLIDAAEGSRGR